VAGVRAVDVDLDTKLVRVSGRDLDPAAVVAAIDEAGYDAEPAAWVAALSASCRLLPVPGESRSEAPTSSASSVACAISTRSAGSSGTDHGVGAGRAGERVNAPLEALDSRSQRVDLGRGLRGGLLHLRDALPERALLRVQRRDVTGGRGARNRPWSVSTRRSSSRTRAACTATRLWSTDSAVRSAHSPSPKAAVADT
jgi:hypothetical protein